MLVCVWSVCVCLCLCAWTDDVEADEGVAGGIRTKTVAAATVYNIIIHIIFFAISRGPAERGEWCI